MQIVNLEALPQGDQSPNTEGKVLDLGGIRKIKPLIPHHSHPPETTIGNVLTDIRGKLNNIAPTPAEDSNSLTPAIEISNPVQDALSQPPPAERDVTPSASPRPSGDISHTYQPDATGLSRRDMLKVLGATAAGVGGFGAFLKKLGFGSREAAGVPKAVIDAARTDASAIKNKLEGEKPEVIESVTFDKLYEQLNSDNPPAEGSLIKLIGEQGYATNMGGVVREIDRQTKGGKVYKHEEGQTAYALVPDYPTAEAIMTDRPVSPDLHLIPVLVNDSGPETNDKAHRIVTKPKTVTGKLDFDKGVVKIGDDGKRFVEVKASDGFHISPALSTTQ